MLQAAVALTVAAQMDGTTADAWLRSQLSMLEEGVGIQRAMAAKNAGNAAAFAARATSGNYAAGATAAADAAAAAAEASAASAVADQLQRYIDAIAYEERNPEANGASAHLGIWNKGVPETFSGAQYILREQVVELIPDPRVRQWVRGMINEPAEWGAREEFISRRIHGVKPTLDRLSRALHDYEIATNIRRAISEVRSRSGGIGHNSIAAGEGEPSLETLLQAAESVSDKLLEPVIANPDNSADASQRRRLISLAAYVGSKLDAMIDAFAVASGKAGGVVAAGWIVSELVPAIGSLRDAMMEAVSSLGGIP